MKETKTILVMDDEPEYVEILRQFLGEAGYHVLTACDGEAGLKIVGNLRPDLVIMDVNMPHMDGLQFYREISTAHGRAKLPVLVITARGELEPLFRELEAEGFLTKPFMISRLLKEVETIFSKKKEKTVFLVDSEGLSRVSKVAEALRRERYRVAFTVDLAAFERELAAGNRPDFVVVEYAMAEKASPRFIRTIKEKLAPKADAGTPSPKVPVIGYTYSGMDYREKCLADGADQYIGRPENDDAIIAAIRKCEIEAKEKK